MLKKWLKKQISKTGYIISKVPKKKVLPVKQDTKDRYDVLNGDVEYPFTKVPFAGETLQYFVTNYEFDSVLDIGSGEGKHSDVLLESDKKVTSIDFGTSVYFEKRSEKHDAILGDYYEYKFEKKFDAIWASHVLEHQPNPNLFLKKVHEDLKEGGVLAISVPPLKHEIVGGHLTLWNAGLLLYQLVFAGFDCSEASIKSYGYNVSVVLRKKTITKYPELSYDSGDIRKLKRYFPPNTEEPFDGQIKEFNWN